CVRPPEVPGRGNGPWCMDSETSRANRMENGPASNHLPCMRSVLGDARNSHPWLRDTSTRQPRIRAGTRPARSRATLAALRARRALGLGADGTRGKARRGIAQELGTEHVEVEAVHQSVIRVIARRLA